MVWLLFPIYFRLCSTHKMFRKAVRCKHRTPKRTWKVYLLLFLLVKRKYAFITAVDQKFSRNTSHLFLFFFFLFFFFVGYLMILSVLRLECQIFTRTCNMGLLWTYIQAHIPSVKWGHAVFYTRLYIVKNMIYLQALGITCNK